MDKFRISGKQFPKRPNGNNAMLRDASEMIYKSRTKKGRKNPTHLKRKQKEHLKSFTFCAR